MTEAELERAKAQVKSSLMMAEEKSAYKSEEIGRTYSIFGKYEGPEVLLGYVNRTNASDILEIAKAIFSTKPCLSVVGADAGVVSYEEVCKRLAVE